MERARGEEGDRRAARPLASNAPGLARDEVRVVRDGSRRCAGSARSAARCPEIIEVDPEAALEWPWCGLRDGRPANAR